MGRAIYFRKQILAAAIIAASTISVAVPATSYAQAPAGAAAATKAPAPAAPTTKAAAPAAKPAAGATAPATGAAGGAGAAAKPNVGDAKKSFASGEAKIKANDFAGALADFQAADAIKSAPQTARYIGLAQDKLGNHADAVTAYERFLADVPPKMTKEADEAKARVAEIKAMPGKLHIETTPAGATVTIDGKPASSPTPVDTEAAPGHHTLHLSADGRVAQDKEIDVTFASKQDVRVELEAVPPPAAAPVAPPVAVTPAPPPPAAAPPPAEPRSKVPAYITGGLAVAAAGVGTVFGIIALGDKSDFDKNPTSGKADDGENHALIADMAFGVALTLGVTSAVLFFSHDETTPPAAASAKGHVVAKAKPRAITITPSPIVTPHGGGAGALLRF